MNCTVNLFLMRKGWGKIDQFRYGIKMCHVTLEIYVNASMIILASSIDLSPSLYACY